MKKLILCLVLSAMLVAVCPATATVQFVDQLIGYTEGASWDTQNAGVTVVYNGPAPVNGRTGPEDPDKAAVLTGPYAEGGVGDFALVSIPVNSSDRYGQLKVDFQMAWWNLTGVDLMANGATATNPQISQLSANSVLEINMHPFGFIQYDDGLGGNPAGSTVGNTMHSYTMNYDLVAQTWDLYLDGVLDVGGIAIDSAYGSVTSIDLAVAWFNYSGNASYQSIFDAVQLQTSATTPFVGEGTYVPEPATMLLLGLGALSVIRRRTKKA